MKKIIALLFFLAPLLMADEATKILSLEKAVEIGTEYLEEKEMNKSHVMAEVALDQNYDGTQLYWSIKLKKTGELLRKGGSAGRLSIDMDGNVSHRMVRAVIITE